MQLLRDLARDGARRIVRRVVVRAMPEHVREVTEIVTDTAGDAADVVRMARSAREVARPEFIEHQRDQLADQADRIRYAERVARIVHAQAKARAR